ncbi:FecR family protein [Pseudoflavitalea sp. G-6-1-2]|uniref:FecR family protein n=1 Tax=Pseudoflavitalea sp. G-6-1-2 TaxID=2728841 RepID=UPI00146E945E|nr:FecR family protein [Pseudoflavitalea sp. G-6-1-2]NML20888.1 FecR family protein [Pseudoflavitalea sp. G-6-1-2]
MLPSNDRFHYLFSRYTTNQCTQDELQELFGHLRHMNAEDLHPYMDVLYANISPGAAAEKISWDELYEKITGSEQASIPVRKLFPYRRVAVAAAVLLVAASAIYLLLPKSNDNSLPPTVASSNDIPPGQDLAVLTLADGTRITLDSSSNGNIASQGGIRIIKEADGKLNYQVQQGDAASASMINMLSTPRGGQYRLTLPDGSRVWLNAASSIRYPAAFSNTQRSVEITGEAYFEIASNSKLPFKVKTPAGEINVLGTSFNVNAYSNEPVVSTTLISGKVSLTTNNLQQPIVLKPGQQVTYPHPMEEQVKSQKIEIRSIDTEPVIAWTRNSFMFTNTSLANAMRQIERWYNVEVTIKGDIGREGIMANLSRDMPISKLMHKLSLTGHLHFSIDGKKITVTR